MEGFGYFYSMWNNVKDIFKSLPSFLQSGKAPTNIPSKYEEELAGINFLRSKKFFIVFTSVAALFLFFGASVFILFLTATIPTLTVPFVTMFVESLKILAVIIASYLGLQTVLDFKWNSESNTSLEGNQTVNQDIVDPKIVKYYAELYRGDKSYAPLEWVEEQPHE